MITSEVDNKKMLFVDDKWITPDASQLYDKYIQEDGEVNPHFKDDLVKELRFLATTEQGEVANSSALDGCDEWKGGKPCPYRATYDASALPVGKTNTTSPKLPGIEEVLRGVRADSKVGSIIDFGYGAAAAYNFIVGKIGR